MVRKIMRDPFFLAQKSEDATEADQQVVVDLLDTLRANLAKDSTATFLLQEEEWANAKYVLDEESKEIVEDIEGTFRQFPLKLAWAITIHKSQGLTFERAIIDASSSFAHG